MGNLGYSGPKYQPCYPQSKVEHFGQQQQTPLYAAETPAAVNSLRNISKHLAYGQK